MSISPIEYMKFGTISQYVLFVFISNMVFFCLFVLCMRRLWVVLLRFDVIMR